jgi:hypothetical protein
VALLLGTGQVREHVGSSAIRILRDAGGLWALARLSFAELSRIPGIRPAKAARLAAAFEAGSRGLISPVHDAAPLSNSEMVFIRHGRPLTSSPVERFVVLSVDAKNRVRAEREELHGVGAPAARSTRLRSSASWCPNRPPGRFSYTTTPAETPSRAPRTSSLPNAWLRRGPCSTSESSITPSWGTDDTPVSAMLASGRVPL